MTESTSTVFKEFPVINLQNFSLRQVRYSDANDFVEYLSQDEVNIYIPEESIPRTLSRAEDEIKYMKSLFNYKQSIYWVIAKNEDDKIIGSCGFNYWNKDHKRAEISYDLAYKYWGKGIMTQAVSEVLQFGFKKMNLKRIEATITPTNTKSINLLKKQGFEQEGLLRKHKILHGRFTDAIIMSLLNC